MLLLSLKNDWQPLLFESEDSGEVWKRFCGLQNKLPKALLFNEANYKRFELSQFKGPTYFVIVIMLSMVFMFYLINDNILFLAFLCDSFLFQ